MLVDPIVIGMPPSGTSLTGVIATSGVFPDAGTFATVEVNPSGSRRVGSLAGVNAELRISHSKSNENAPYLTSRSLIRFDLNKVDEAGKQVTLSAYAVISFPTTSLFTISDAERLARTLGAFLLCGSTTDVGDNDYPLNRTGDLTVRRIIQGEP